MHVHAPGPGSKAAGRDIISIAIHAGDEREPPPGRLHQLPGDLADFTGREEEVEKLLAVLRGGAGQAAISALGGMGGIGKTALAVHVAHRLAPEFPAAQIVVDLMGTADTPLSPAAGMGYVVRAFHPEARLPEGPEDMAGLYLSVLAGKRALLLLDNARDAAQVRALLPPPSCGVLVTSRRTIVLPGVAALNLDVLPEPEAVTLLETIAGAGRATREEFQNVARLCGRLPLALRVAGSFVAGHPDWTVAEYLAALADEKARLKHLKHEVDDVEAVLGLSAAQLARDNEELAARWQMLSVFPGSFDRAAAAAVWEVTENETREGLSELLARSLLLFDPEKRRYRLHDLVRLVAGKAFDYGGEEPDRQAEAQRLSEAARRHAAHYAGVLRVTNDLYLKGGESIQAGLNLFDTEWDNIRAGQAWAEVQAGEGEAAARLSSHYPDAAADVLSLRLHPREWIEWLTAALAAARRLRDRTAEGAHLGNLGNLNAALEALLGLQDRTAEGRHLNNLGNAYFSLGEYRRALEFHEQALVFFRDRGDRQGEGYVLVNLGNIYYYLGDPRRAVEYYKQQLVITREIGDRRGEGTALGNLGNAYYSLGEYRRAMELYEQRLVIAREIGDRRGEGAALGNLGLAYAALGEYRRAIEFYEQQLAITREIGDRLGESIALWNMSLALDKVGERGRAIACAEASLTIFEAIESPHAETVRRQLAAWRGQG